MTHSKRPTTKWMKRMVMTVAATLIVCIVYSTAYIGGMRAVLVSKEEPYQYALKKTGITEELYPGLVLHDSNHSRDSYTQTLFSVPKWDRISLLEQMRQTENWHIEAIQAFDFRGFANVTWYSELNHALIADDVQFDAWYYVVRSPSWGDEETPSGYFSKLGRVGRGFTFALFDVETGLFVFIDQFG